MSRLCVLIFCLLATVTCAQQPAALVDPAPFTPAAPLESTGDWARRVLAAERALALGLPAVAAEGFSRLLAESATTGAQRERLIVGLATAWLDEDRVEEAAKALALSGAGNSPALRLRASLIELRRGRLAQAREQWSSLASDGLPPSERGWYFFVQGQLADAAGDFVGAREAYGQAETLATSTWQRARFTLSREQARLSLGEATEEQARALRQNYERFQGKLVGYGYARQLALVLAALGRKAEAVSFLVEQLQSLPTVERTTVDEFRLLLGLVAGPRSGVGRKALEDLVATGADPSLQRVALQLWQSLPPDTAFYRFLERLIASPFPHPLLEDMLLVRAQLALTEGVLPVVPVETNADVRSRNRRQAESDVQSLLDKFPGSPLKAAALGLLAQAAWEQFRYRAAADYAAQARAALPAGDLRAALGLLTAEAYFRAGDFFSSAEAYRVALNEVPAGVPPGLLMAQAVLAELEGGRLEVAEKLLDAYITDARLDPVNRWEAEWRLARALQAAKQAPAALRRVSALLEASVPTTAEPPGDLRIRLGWLQTQLLLATGAYAEVAAAVQRVVDQLPQSTLQPELRGEIEASLRLVEVKAAFSADRAPAALELLQQIRQRHPQSDAAVVSYMEEADYYAGKNLLVDAQKRLIELADTYPQHRYAPTALFNAALYAERRGEEIFLQEANRLLEERLIKGYPQHPLVFYVRLKQGDLLRRLNDFGSAQRAYEYLVNNYASHPEVNTAWLALGAAHRAQINAGEVTHTESALAIFERLQDLPTATPDLRIESAFQLGDLLAQPGRQRDLKRAQQVWWSIANDFLLDEAQATRLQGGGRYWAARAMLRLGDLLQEQGSTMSARSAYELILQLNLPFQRLARTALDRKES